MRISRSSAAAACLALAFGGAACVGKGAGAETAGPNINPAIGRNVTFYPQGSRRTVSFAGDGLDGSPIRSADMAGLVVVVNFWAEWCPPCRVEQPVLEKVWREYKDRGVRFVGIDIRDSLTKARAFVEEFGVTYPSIFNKDASLAARFRVRSPPATFVLDGRGRIAARIDGATATPAEMRAVIDEVLES